MKCLICLALGKGFRILAYLRAMADIPICRLLHIGGDGLVSLPLGPGDESSFVRMIGGFPCPWHHFVIFLCRLLNISRDGNNGPKLCDKVLGLIWSDAHGGLAEVQLNRVLNAFDYFYFHISIVLFELQFNFGTCIEMVLRVQFVMPLPNISDRSRIIEGLCFCNYIKIVFTNLIRHFSLGDYHISIVLIVPDISKFTQRASNRRTANIIPVFNKPFL